MQPTNAGICDAGCKLLFTRLIIEGARYSSSDNEFDLPSNVTHLLVRHADYY